MQPPGSPFVVSGGGNMEALRSALATCEKGLGPDHPDTATSLTNLARLLPARGDLAGSVLLHCRALAIREKALGPNHSDTATTLDNLARLLRRLGSLAEAAPLTRRALATRVKSLGADHPDTATGFRTLPRASSPHILAMPRCP